MVPGVHPSLAERHALCDLFEQLGPDAPTRCEGWATREMAAHLWTREHRLDAGPGLLGRGPFAGYTARLEAETARKLYAEIVGELRAGPPAFWFGRWFPDADLHEWFVHHEDVRRANDLPARTNEPELEAGLWKVLGLWGRILTRRAEVGIELETPTGQHRTAHPDEPAVVLRGRPSELMLRLWDRDGDVTVEGSPDARTAFERSRLGI